MGAMAADGGAHLLAAAIKAAVLAGAPRRTVQAVAVGVAGVIWHPRTPGAATAQGAEQEAGAPDEGDLPPDALRAARQRRRREKKKQKRHAIQQQKQEEGGLLGSDVNDNTKQELEANAPLGNAEEHQSVQASAAPAAESQGCGQLRALLDVEEPEAKRQQLLQQLHSGHAERRVDNASHISMQSDGCTEMTLSRCTVMTPQSRVTVMTQESAEQGVERGDERADDAAQQPVAKSRSPHRRRRR